MTVDQLLSSISSYEITEWMEYFKFRDEKVKEEIEKEKQKAR